jgi:hypothetical protein
LHGHVLLCTLTVLNWLKMAFTFIGYLLVCVRSKLGIIFNDWKATQTGKVKTIETIVLIHTTTIIV